MTLGYPVVLPLESGILPFHKVMSRYEQMWAIGINKKNTFESSTKEAPT